jgi:CubicO group peptidase (beta-lactamase class C family)
VNLRTLLHRPVRDDVGQPDGRPAAQPDGQPVVGWGSAEPASADPAAYGSRYEALEAYLEAQMRRLRIPGASLVVIEGDRIVHSRGFGKARPGGEVPSPRTPFALGSTTKSVTALAVMQLAEVGKLELDAPVQRYLPWFRVADPQASARITVRHLLNQTSGMSMVAGTACLADPDDGPGAAERQARRLSSLSLSRPVGARFQYCNLNYNLLGLIIEATSGRSYSEYVQQHVFEPLGMHRTYTSREPAKRAGLAVGHRYWFGVPIAAPDMSFPSSGLAAGGLVSTSEDMAHYLIAHLNGGRYEDTRVLSGAGVDELHRRVAEQRVMGAAVTGYGTVATCPTSPHSWGSYRSRARVSSCWSIPTTASPSS